MKKIELKEVFTLQATLDNRIHKEHNVSYASTTSERTLALAVELMELANEIRCFKYWSFKGPSAKEIILDEYVDGLHFIVSLSLAFGVETNFEIEDDQVIDDKHKLTGIFLCLLDKINNLKDKNIIEEWLHRYISLGYNLGFDINQIIAGYHKKNNINHKRQDQKY